MKKCLWIIVLVTWAASVGATGDNIARLANVKVSSAVGEQTGEKAIDGKIRLFNQGEWRSTGSVNFYGQIDYPWIELEWKQEEEINEVVLYDRPSLESHIAGGILHFSDGSEIEVYEIPNDGSPKLIRFPAKKVRWVRFECTDADGKEVGLSEIEVNACGSSNLDFVSKVNPFIETTRGRYFFFVTGSLPFGMISAAPLTRNKNQYGGGYNYNSTEILGFPQIHDWMLSGVTLMPTTGNESPIGGEKEWKSPFHHAGEIARPGYHRVFLEKYGLWVEQTASDRVSFYRVQYTGEDNTHCGLLLNLGGYVATTTMTNARVRKCSPTELEGEVTTMGRLWGGPDSVKIYFALQLDKPMEDLDGWDDTRFYEQIDSLLGTGKAKARHTGMSYYDAPSSGVRMNIPVRTGDEIQIKCAVSYTSVENAWANLHSEIQHWDFEKACRDARQVWNDYLGRIEVEGGTEDQQVKFYTDLWHVLLGRHKIDDVNGDYPDYTDGERRGSQTVHIRYKTRTLPKDPQGNVKFHMYNSDAFWLTQWNLNILWGLAWPEVQDDFAACLIEYAKNGGLIPRGPNAGGYSYIMTGCPATPLITSAYQKGILTKVSAEEAYKWMYKNHHDGMLGDRNSIRFYEKHGYFADNAGITLEAAFQDWSLGQMAFKMGKMKDARHFDKRSKGWQTLYHPEQGLLFPKRADGSWLHEDPLNGAGWVEANAWQATWSVSHGIEELARLMGGNENLCRKLNYAFEQAQDESFVFGYSNGYVSYANQPGCSNAHVFNYAGAPQLSQYWVRQVNEKAYGAVSPGKGYGGHDEDQGQMGGVSVLMSIGLFSLKGTCSVDPVYEITAPVFDVVRIKLSPTYYSGKEFVIRTYNNSKSNCYIRKSSLNGKPLDTFWFYHKDFAKGGTLELWLDDSFPEADSTSIK